MRGTIYVYMFVYVHLLAPERRPRGSELVGKGHHGSLVIFRRSRISVLFKNPKRNYFLLFSLLFFFILNSSFIFLISLLFFFSNLTSFFSPSNCDTKFPLFYDSRVDFIWTYSFKLNSFKYFLHSYRLCLPFTLKVNFTIRREVSQVKVRSYTSYSVTGNKTNWEVIYYWAGAHSPFPTQAPPTHTHMTCTREST